MLALCERLSGAASIETSAADLRARIQELLREGVTEAEALRRVCDERRRRAERAPEYEDAWLQLLAWLGVEDRHRHRSIVSDVLADGRWRVARYPARYVRAAVTVRMRSRLVLKGGQA